MSQEQMLVMSQGCWYRCHLHYVCSSVLQQMHTDVATGQVHSELQDAVASVDHLVTELQELSAKLRDQSQ